MVLDKKKKLLLFITILYAFIILMMIISTIIGTGEYNPLISFLPIGNPMIEIVILMLVFYPLSMLLGCLIGQYGVFPLYLFFHKKFIGRKMEYGACFKPEEKVYKTKYNLFIPSFIAVNFSLLLVMNFEDLLIHLFLTEATWNDTVQIFLVFDIFIITFTFTLLIAMAIYSPVWYLLESNIVYSNKKKVEYSRDPFEIRSVGSWYRTFLRGYAGIGLLIAYIQCLIFYFNNLVEQETFALQIFILVVALMPFPIILALFGLWITLFLEITKEKRKKYITKLMKEFDIIKKVDVSMVKLDRK